MVRLGGVEIRLAQGEIGCRVCGVQGRHGKMQDTVIARVRNPQVSLGIDRDAARAVHGVLGYAARVGRTRGKIRLTVYSIRLDPGGVGERLGKAEDAAVAEVGNVEIACDGIYRDTERKAESIGSNAILVRLLGVWLTQYDGRGVAILEGGGAGPAEDTMIGGIGHVQVAIVIHRDCLRRRKGRSADHVNAVLAEVGLPQRAVSRKG